MKNLLILAVLLISNIASAGSSTCTNVTHVTASGDYYASNVDCVISIEKTVSEGTYIWLPTAASQGDKFSVVDATSYTLDTCENAGTEEEPVMVCYPAGVTVQSADSPSVTVDNAESTTLSGDYYQGSPSRQTVSLLLNGTNWDATYSRN